MHAKSLFLCDFSLGSRSQYADVIFLNTIWDFLGGPAVSTARSVDLISGQGTKIPQAAFGSKYIYINTEMREEALEQIPVSEKKGNTGRQSCRGEYVHLIR